MPRYFPIVRALAGDSTMTSDLLGLRVVFLRELFFFAFFFLAVVFFVVAIKE